MAGSVHPAFGVCVHALYWRDAFYYGPRFLPILTAIYLVVTRKVHILLHMLQLTNVSYGQGRNTSVSFQMMEETHTSPTYIGALIMKEAPSSKSLPNANSLVSCMAWWMESPVPFSLSFVKQQATVLIIYFRYVKTTIEHLYIFLLVPKHSGYIGFPPRSVVVVNRNRGCPMVRLVCVCVWIRIRYHDSGVINDTRACSIHRLYYSAWNKSMAQHIIFMA
jgi:hypothetical protein